MSEMEMDTKLILTNRNNYEVFENIIIDSDTVYDSL